MKKNFKHISVEGPISDEFEKLRKELERKGYHSTTNSEIMKVLFRKNEKVRLSFDDLDEIFMGSRGVNHAGEQA